MITDLQERKLDKMFRYLDADSNGALEFQDLLGYASRLTSAFEVSPAAPKGQAIVDGFHVFWEALLSAIDLDGDRRITLEEWRAGMTGAFIEDGEGFSRSLRPAAQAVMNLADTDGDGTVSRSEFSTSAEALGMGADDRDVAFDRLDVDGNGTLSVDELVGAVAEYFTSADPQVRGNWLLGAV